MKALETAFVGVVLLIIAILTISCMQTLNEIDFKKDIVGPIVIYNLGHTK